MASDVSGIDEYVCEVAAGQCAIVAALVIALHENGILPQDRYGDVLRRLWSGMPEEEAVGEAGAVIERVLDLLSARAGVAYQVEDAEQKQKISTFARRAVNDDAIARPAPRPAPWP